MQTNDMTRKIAEAVQFNGKQVDVVTNESYANVEEWNGLIYGEKWEFVFTGFGELRFSIRLRRSDIDNANSNAPRETEKEIEKRCKLLACVCVWLDLLDLNNH